MSTIAKGVGGRWLSGGASPILPLHTALSVVVEKLSRLISQASIVKSGKDHIRNVSWIDKDLAHRFKLLS